MRTISAARMKGNGMGHTNRIPREGTHLRKIWDLFQSTPGVVIPMVLLGKNKNTLFQLRDFYGLDIRCIRYGKWCLCGEWVQGGGYIDYVAARHGMDGVKEGDAINKS
jgi:hypothetical protein